MRIFIILLVLLALAGGYFYFYPDTWRDLTKGTPLEPPPTITTLYKWKNTDGFWEITDKPPEDGIPYELLEYSSDRNVMPPLVTEEELDAQ